MGGPESAAGLFSGEAAAEILERKAELESGDVGVAGSGRSGSSGGGSEFLGGRVLTSEEVAGLTDVERTNLAAGNNQTSLEGGNSDEGEWYYSLDDVPDEAVSVVETRTQSADEGEWYYSLEDVPDEPSANVEVSPPIETPSTPVETPLPVVDQGATTLPPETLPSVVDQGATTLPPETSPSVVDQGATTLPPETSPSVVDQGATTLPPETLPSVVDQGATTLPPETLPSVVDQGATTLPPETPSSVVDQGATTLPPETLPSVVDQGATTLPPETSPAPPGLEKAATDQTQIDQRADVADQVANERLSADQKAFEAAASENTRQWRDLQIDHAWDRRADAFREMGINSKSELKDYASEIRESYNSKVELPSYRTAYAKVNDSGNGGLVVLDNPNAQNGGTIMNNDDPMNRLDELARKR